MEQRHGAVLDLPPEPSADDESRTLARLVDEPQQHGEIVGLIPVAHQHELATRLKEAPLQGGAIAFYRAPDDARTRCLCDAHARVGAAVVGDDHLAGDSCLFQGAQRLLDAGGDRLLFIEAGNDDGQLQGLGSRTR